MNILGGNPKIAVVIPALNEVTTISAVIASLLPKDLNGPSLRIIVADGGSVDGTREVVNSIAATDQRVSLVANPKCLQSAAVNLVAKQVSSWAAWLVRCDAHAAYPPNFVEKIVRCLMETSADSVTVPMDSFGTTDMGRAIAWVSNTRIGSGGSAHRGGEKGGWVDHGHHAGWKLTSFLANGGYDESFSHNEDAEFDCRLRARGGRVWLASEIRISYLVRPTLKALWKQYRNYGKGRFRTVTRHPSSMRARQLALPCFVVANAIALVFGFAYPPLWYLPGAYIALLVGVSVSAMQNIGWAGWRAGLAAATMHIGWTIGFISGAFARRQVAETHTFAADFTDKRL